jgi:hypothetical protein
VTEYSPIRACHALKTVISTENNSRSLRVAKWRNSLLYPPRHSCTFTVAYLQVRK